MREGQLRPDLNLNDRVYVEVKMFPLRKYGDNGWKRRQLNMKYNVDKLKQYVAHQESLPSVLKRTPVLAMWFRKRGTKNVQENSSGSLFISNELNELLEKERKRYSKEATLLFGPRK